MSVISAPLFARWACERAHKVRAFVMFLISIVPITHHVALTTEIAKL